MAERRGDPSCADCPSRACERRASTSEQELSTAQPTPEFCPMRCIPDVFRSALVEYDKPNVREFARKAAVQEFECYERTANGMRPRLPRVEELVEFARKCSYEKLGIAHCTGLMTEARILKGILQKKGFRVVTVQCKTGAVPKERIGVRPDQKIVGAGSWESMCNPIAQAMILNTAKVDLAIMLGLCIGHDTLFIKHCEVPLTVLAVKDRVLGHNPLAALYLSSSYYHHLDGPSA